MISINQFCSINFINFHPRFFCFPIIHHNLMFLTHLKRFFHSNKWIVSNLCCRILKVLIVIWQLKCNCHCVKSVQIWSYFWSVFSPNTEKYGPETTSYLDTFHAVCDLAILQGQFNNLKAIYNNLKLVVSNKI